MSSTLESLPSIEEVVENLIYDHSTALRQIPKDQKAKMNAYEAHDAADLIREHARNTAVDLLKRIMAAVRIDEYANHMPHTRNKTSYHVEMSDLEERMDELRKIARHG